MRQTVLIVDDSLPLHTLIKTQLKADNLVFHSAHSGESGILMASSFRPDLILLDVDMPGLDGFEVCQRLKANALTSAIHITFLTANSMLTDKVRGLEYGAADYIVKPFKPEELTARVRAALRTARQSTQTSLVDSTTGLWNRSYFELQQKVQLSLAKRSGRPASCIVIEIDRWNSISVKAGEPALNEILQTISPVLVGQARTEDVVCRYDTGKFAMLLPNTSSGTATRLAERLGGEIESKLDGRGGACAGVTCSFGVADSLVSSEHSLVERADKSVSRAQKIGHNAVAVARDRSSSHLTAVAA